MLHFNRSFVLLVLATLLAACAGPAAAPTATPVPTTATPGPPTATPTLVPPAATPAPSPPAAAGKIETIEGQITSQALAGNLLGDPTTREFYVLLPPSYATSDKRYPVVYVLHHYTGNAFSMVGPIKLAYQNALRTGDLQEMIFVFPNANNTLGGSGYLSSPTIGDYETYLTQELVAQIDATYRTLADRSGRGITGCSMGGDGSIHLALKYPGTFSVAAPASGTYDWARDPTWKDGTKGLESLPEDMADVRSLGWQARWLLAGAAAVAPNPAKPPFYLDMPVATVNGEAQIVPEVFDKMAAVDPVHDVDRYLAQPERLRAILIYHGNKDNNGPVELARDFDKLLSDRGIEHQYLEINAGHCNFHFDPIVKFMSDHLVGEEQPQN